MIKIVSDLRHAGVWFFPGILVSSTDKTDLRDITEILLKVALSPRRHTKNNTMAVDWLDENLKAGYR
jgi:hypothetical protein